MLTIGELPGAFEWADTEQ